MPVLARTILLFLLAVSSCRGSLKHMRQRGKNKAEKKDKTTTVVVDASKRTWGDNEDDAGSRNDSNGAGSAGDVDFGGGLIVSESEILKKRVGGSGKLSARDNRRNKTAAAALSANGDDVLSHEANMELIRSKKGVILFTHMRRAGGKAQTRFFFAHVLSLESPVHLLAAFILSSPPPSSIFPFETPLWKVLSLRSMYSNLSSSRRGVGARTISAERASSLGLSTTTRTSN